MGLFKEIVLRLVAAVLASAMAAMLVTRAAAQSWPAKPVRVIVQAPVGGPTDIVTRGASQYLSQSLGQPFVVENRAGANGIVGAEACRRAAPDGYSICGFNAQAISQNPVMYAKLPYDPVKDFVPRSGQQSRESWKVKVLPPSIARFGRLAYPLLGEVTDRDMRGSKSHGCPA